MRCYRSIVRPLLVVGCVIWMMKLLVHVTRERSVVFVPQHRMYLDSNETQKQTSPNRTIQNGRLGPGRPGCVPFVEKKVGVSSENVKMGEKPVGVQRATKRTKVSSTWGQGYITLQ